MTIKQMRITITKQRNGKYQQWLMDFGQWTYRSHLNYLKRESSINYFVNDFWNYSAMRKPLWPPMPRKSLLLMFSARPSFLHSSMTRFPLHCRHQHYSHKTLRLTVNVNDRPGLWRQPSTMFSVTNFAWILFRFFLFLPAEPAWMSK